MKNGATTIKIMLLKKGITQRQIADLLQITHQCVNNTINRKNKKSRRVTTALAIALGKTPEEISLILYGIESKPKPTKEAGSNVG
jgi:lambda repressor-like predicted transcriptional regulator